LSPYRPHSKNLSLTSWIERCVSFSTPTPYRQTSGTLRRGLATSAVITACVLVFYALPTFLELKLTPYLGTTKARFLLGNVLGCAAIALVHWRIAALLYAGLSLFDLLLLRFGGVRPAELLWFTDIVPTVFIIVRLTLARSSGPAENTQTGEEAPELNSWKAIADYLDINVRTAQRWEQERGLPVRRFSGEKGRVLALPADLERWRKTNLVKPNWWGDLRLLRFALIAATVLLFASVGWSVSNYVREHRLGPPAHLTLDDSQIIVRDSNGRRLWTHQFSEPTLPSDKHAFWFGHLTTATNTDTLFHYRTERMASSELYCFSEKGEPRWKFTPGRPVSDASLDYPSVYFINAFKVLPGATLSESRIVVSSNHGWSHPDQVAVLAPDGRLLGEYWHSGHLTSMAVDDSRGSSAPACPRIILGGVDNGRQLANLVVLDPDRVHGALQEEDNSPFQLKGFGPGTEQAVVWFNRTCLNEGSEPFNYVMDVTLVPGGIEVVVREVGSSGAYIVYVLDKDFNVTYLEPSSGFRERHRELEQEGKLDHRWNDKELDRLRHIRVVRRTVAHTSY